VTSEVQITVLGSRPNSILGYAQCDMLSLNLCKEGFLFASTIELKKELL